MTHTTDCPVTNATAGQWKTCTCHEPDTDWAPDLPCGGIATSVNGGPFSEPPLCEVHMKPWRHRRPTADDQTGPGRQPNDREAS